MSDAEAATINAVTQLIEQAKQKAYEEGFTAGRLALADEIRDWLETDIPAIKPAYKPRKNRLVPIQEEPPPGVPTQAVDLKVNVDPEPEPPHLATVEDAIREVLADLAEKFPQGVEPDAIAEFLRDSPMPVDVKQVRASLRTLLLGGEVSRVAEGRFLPRLKAEEPAA